MSEEKIETNEIELRQVNKVGRPKVGRPKVGRPKVGRPRRFKDAEECYIYHHDLRRKKAAVKKIQKLFDFVRESQDPVVVKELKVVLEYIDSKK